MKIITLPSTEKKQGLLEVLTSLGYNIDADCGGFGKCGKCKVKVISGSFYMETNPEKIYLPDKDGNILSCLAQYLGNDCAVGLYDTEKDIICVPSESYIGKICDEEFGIALDIGTTTISMALVGKNSGKIYATESCNNPQRAVSSDIMGRISACRDEKMLYKMQSLIIDCTKELFEKLYRNVGRKARVLYVSGNTAMLHIFCGVSPIALGSYPFTPDFTELRKLNGNDLGLDIENVVILPSSDAFIGSDIVCGIAKTKMTEFAYPSLLIDIGTNAEIALFAKGRLYTTSAAAGPALEGAEISCGRSASNGAVNHVKILSRALKTLAFTTISDEKPNGICASGLIDLISCLKDLDIIHKNGSLDADFALSGIFLSSDGEILENSAASTDVILTNKDVQSFLLAKSAIRSGLEALCDYGKVELKSIGKCFVAGSLGYYLDVKSAVNAGIIPKELEKSAELVGNTSLDGASACVHNPEFCDLLCDISKRCENLNLNEYEFFGKRFVENMGM